MESNERNFVRADEEGTVIRVYDDFGLGGFAEFSETATTARRRSAERFAEKMAAALGCDWGANF